MNNTRKGNGQNNTFHALVVSSGVVVTIVKYLYLSQLGAFFLVHFRQLGLNIWVISDGVRITRSIF